MSMLDISEEEVQSLRRNRLTKLKGKQDFKPAEDSFLGNKHFGLILQHRAQRILHRNDRSKFLLLKKGMNGNGELED